MLTGTDRPVITTRTLMGRM